MFNRLDKTTVRQALVLTGLWVLLFWLGPGLARGGQTMRGHWPAAARLGVPLGRMGATNRLGLAIGLPLRHQAELNLLLGQIYDPASTNYHRYLTPEEFTVRFGPSERDYAQLIAFARQQGLTVTKTHPNRMVLNVSGRVAEIEKTFHVNLRTYAHDRKKRTYFAPDRDPVVDLAVPLLHVSGLDNYARPHPKSVIRGSFPSAPAGTAVGSGTNGSYIGNDFRAAYVPGVPETGTGQSVALLEYDGYVSNDITAYETNAGLAAVPLENVPVEGGVSELSSNNIEVALDIEMVISMAPGISNVMVYEAPNSSSWSTILNQMATDNAARQISCSWGDDAPSLPDLTTEQIFEEMAAQGQTFFNATGDSDAFVGGIPFPSESPNIVQVGGTTLSTAGAGGTWSSERVWNWGNDEGSSGGISASYALPEWQQGIDMTTNKGSTQARNVPDVALTADNILVIANTNESINVGGTSCAAPLWAGLMALINQRAASNGQAPLGFLNPALYNLGRSAGYTNCFHDITRGNNFNSSSTNLFHAAPGYDLCTGWGTPMGANLIAALSDSLGVSPVGGVASAGEVGGPFTPATMSFDLTNSGAGNLNWSLGNLPAWLTVAVTNGVLLPGGSLQLTAWVNTAADVLPGGVYFSMVSFNSGTNGVSENRTVTLRVGQSLVKNGGFETGDFSDWTYFGKGEDDNLIYDAVEPGIIYPDVVHSGNYGALLGDDILATLAETLPTIPGRTYQLSFWLENLISASGQHFVVDWNTNGSSNPIYNAINPPAFSETNLTFLLTATETSTVLQFGAKNFANYFGLDDVSVIPVPAPSIVTAIRQNGSFSLSWYTVPGLAYQVFYATNLAQASWVSLGTNTAADFTLSFTNKLGADGQRFYRVGLVR